MNVLLFGGTSGIGKAIYENISQYSSSIIVLVRNKKKFNKIFEKKSNTKVYQYDLSDSNNLFNYLNDIDIKHKFDSLIYSVGLESTFPLKLVQNDILMKTFNVNFFSAFQALRYFSQKKISSDNSSVVFLNSVMSEFGAAGKTIYCSSKSALNGLIKSSSIELAKRNIRVNGISPSVVNNNMGLNLINNLPDEEKIFYKKKHAMGYINNSDIVNLIDFLISQKSLKITGQNIMLDSGYSIQ
tara:strand:- start:3924 stop:4646 length:723 start_codon:yes stop_codon:yes gene_type:complete